MVQKQRIQPEQKEAGRRKSESIILRSLATVLQTRNYIMCQDNDTKARRAYNNKRFRIITDSKRQSRSYKTQLYFTSWEHTTKLLCSWIYGYQEIKGNDRAGLRAKKRGKDLFVPHEPSYWVVYRPGLCGGKLESYWEKNIIFTE